MYINIDSDRLGINKNMICNTGHYIHLVPSESFGKIYETDKILISSEFKSFQAKQPVCLAKKMLGFKQYGSQISPKVSRGLISIHIICKGHLGSSHF